MFLFMHKKLYPFGNVMSLAKMLFQFKNMPVDGFLMIKSYNEFSYAWILVKHFLHNYITNTDQGRL